MNVISIRKYLLIKKGWICRTLREEGILDFNMSKFVSAKKNTLRFWLALRDKKILDTESLRVYLYIVTFFHVSYAFFSFIDLHFFDDLDLYPSKLETRNSY